MARHGNERINESKTGPIAFGRFVLDSARGKLLLAGREVCLPERSLRLLEVLIAAAGETVSKDRLVAEVWPGAFVSDTSLTEAMSRLRQALGTNAREQRYVQTVHGEGYRFAEPLVTAEAAAPRALPSPRRLRFAASWAGLAAALSLAGGLSLVLVSDRGNSAPVAQPEDPRYRLLAVTADGEPAVDFGIPALPIQGFSVDRSGDRVAFSLANGEGSDAWVLEVQRGELRRFTEGGKFLDPVWRPDGQAVALAEHRDDSFDLVLKSVDSDLPAQVLHRSHLDSFPESWSRDGRSLVFSQRHPETGFDLWLLRQLDDGAWKPQPLVVTPRDEAFGALSPDGRYVAFTSMVRDRPDVYVVALDGDGTPLRVSPEGGAYPFWSTAGDLLHFVHGDRLLTVATAGLGQEEAPRPQRSQPVSGLYLAGSTNTADRFVVARLDDEAETLR